MEKRHHDRYPAGICCRIWWDRNGLPVQGRIIDLSLGGALVETAEPYSVDTFVVEMQVYGLRQRLPMQRIAFEETAGGLALRAQFISLGLGQEVMLLAILHDLEVEQCVAVAKLVRPMGAA